MGLTIGLTGGIGVGKSTVATILKKYGVQVFDSDQEAKKILDQNVEVIASIKKLLGEEAYIDGQYNSSFVAKLVFEAPSLLRRLNDIVHPPVIEVMKAWAAEHTEVPYKVVESAILIESGLSAYMDRILVVTAPLQLRVNRVRRRNNMTRQQVMARIEQQLNFDTFVAPNVIYINNDETSSLIEQVDSLLLSNFSLSSFDK